MRGNMDKGYEAHLLPSNIENGLERIISLNWIAQLYLDSEWFDKEHIKEVLETIGEVSNSILHQFSEWHDKQPDGKVYQIFDESITSEKEVIQISQKQSMT